MLVLAGARIVYLTQSSLMQLSVALGGARNLITARCFDRYLKVDD